MSCQMAMANVSSYNFSKEGFCCREFRIFYGKSKQFLVILKEIFRAKYNLNKEKR